MLKFMMVSALFAAPFAHGAEQVFGEPMPAGDAAALASAEVGDADAAPRKISGRIVEVCQNKGCWAMLEDEGRAARVMMKGHAFFLPKDASGPAIVFGRLQAKTLDAKTAQHLAEDAGKAEPAAREELRIDASSVVLQDG